jgi:hypothetical protein
MYFQYTDYKQQYPVPLQKLEESMFFDPENLSNLEIQQVASLNRQDSAKSSTNSLTRQTCEYFH